MQSAKSKSVQVDNVISVGSVSQVKTKLASTLSRMGLPNGGGVQVISSIAEHDAYATSFAERRKKAKALTPAEVHQNVRKAIVANNDQGDGSVFV